MQYRCGCLMDHLVFKHYQGGMLNQLLIGNLGTGRRGAIIDFDTYLMIWKNQCIGNNNILWPPCCKNHDFGDIIRRQRFATTGCSL
jgi:hypothetical protein